MTRVIFAALLIAQVTCANAADVLGPQPTVGARRAFDPLVPATRKLSSGSWVWVAERHELPLVSLTVLVPGGSADDPLGKEGRAALTDGMLVAGAGDRTAEAFADEVDRLAIDLSADTRATWSQITLDCAREILPEALDLLTDMLSRPRFDGDEFARRRELAAQSLRQDLDDPATIARNVANRVFWGDTHPLSRPVSGTTRGLEALTVADLRTYHDARWRPERAVFVIAGDVMPDEAVALLDARFASWQAKEPAPAFPVMAPVLPERLRMYFVDKPGSAQTAIRILSPGVALGDDDQLPLQLAATVMGGTFTSRLNRLLREEMGITYGVRTVLETFPETGSLVTRTSVVSSATAAGLGQLLDQLGRLPAGVADDELAKAQGAYRTFSVEALETVGHTVTLFGPYAIAGLGPERMARDLDVIEALRAADVGVVVKRRLPDVRGAVVLVGDAATVRPQLAAAGFTELTLLDLEGSPLDE